MPVHPPMAASSSSTGVNASSSAPPDTIRNLPPRLLWTTCSPSAVRSSVTERRVSSVMPSNVRRRRPVARLVARLEEVDDRRPRVVPFDQAEMAGPLEDPQAGALDPAGELLGHGRRRGEVVGADQYQRVGPYVGQPVGRVEAGEGPAGGGVGARIGAGEDLADPVDLIAVVAAEALGEPPLALERQLLGAWRMFGRLGAFGPGAQPVRAVRGGR